MKEILHSFVSSLHNKFSSHPIKRGIYAIDAGDYAGEFFVYIRKDGDKYSFLSLPKNECRYVPGDALDRGIKSKIITFIQVLPNNIFEVCQAQFNTSLKTMGKISRKRR